MLNRPVIKIALKATKKTLAYKWWWWYNDYDVIKFKCYILYISYHFWAGIFQPIFVLIVQCISDSIYYALKKRIPNRNRFENTSVKGITQSSIFIVRFYFEKTYELTFTVICEYYHLPPSMAVNCSATKFEVHWSKLFTADELENTRKNGTIKWQPSVIPVQLVPQSFWIRWKARKYKSTNQRKIALFY